jgi:predicted membrane protein (TIGR00267 family)
MSRALDPHEHVRRLELEHHTRLDPHHRHSALSDVILGGQDGLVNVLGVILGVAAASGDTRIILAAGMAATFAESVSMGAVAYTSTIAESDLYLSEREREYRHIDTVPFLERSEIRKIFEAKGFQGELLERIVETITDDPHIWVDQMMAEEHQLVPSTRSDARRSALIVGLSAIVGSLIPIIPFVFLPVGPSMIVSIVLAALSLFAVGAYKARVTVGRPGRSGLEMAVIGILSALVGYVVGLLFRVPPTP